MVTRAIFAQPDHPGNAAPADPLNQTGFQRTGVSATAVPQQDPEVFEASAVEKRLANVCRPAAAIGRQPQRHRSDLRMSKSKQERRERVGGPMNNPQNLAASMSPLPGAPQGPGNIQNNPGNAMRVNQPQLSSMQGFNAFPYGDVEGTGIPQNDGRMGGVFAGPNLRSTRERGAWARPQRHGPLWLPAPAAGSSRRSPRRLPLHG